MLGRSALRRYALDFRFKPVDPRRAPTPERVLPCHMPRLDWNAWFLVLHPAAGTAHGGPLWFQRFLLKVLEGQPDVTTVGADDDYIWFYDI